MARLNGIQIAQERQFSSFLDKLEKDLKIEYNNIIKHEVVKTLPPSIKWQLFKTG